MAEFRPIPILRVRSSRFAASPRGDDSREIRARFQKSAEVEMDMKHTCALLGLSVVLAFAGSARAQATGPYLGASFSYAALEAPFDSQLRLAFDPVLSVGYTVSARHVIEVSVSHIVAEESGVWVPASGEAPYTIGFRATPLTLAYRHRVPLADGRIQPFVDVGAVWARVVDFWESDTPRERRTADLFGGSAHVGAQWGMTARLSLLASVGYRRFRNDSGRPARAFGLRGSLARMGLQFHL